jgi:hypothetical protein
MSTAAAAAAASAAAAAAAKAVVSGRCELQSQRRQQAIGVTNDSENDTAAVLAVVRCAESAIGTAEPRATGASKGPPSARHQDRLGSRHKGMDPGEVYVRSRERERGPARQPLSAVGGR